MKNSVSLQLVDLDVVDYSIAWQRQESLFEALFSYKTRQLSGETLLETKPESTLIFCEHPHVYTLGKHGKEENLLLDSEELSSHQASFYKINRGGDITYHGPGQLVGYPILDLDDFGLELKRYVDSLETAVIKLLDDYGLKAGRIHGASGVWLGVEDQASARKICAIGVRASKKITMHGFALNVNTNLSYFSHIVPCGIADKGVTSMQKEMGKEIDMNQVKRKLKHYLANEWGAVLTDAKE